MRIKKSVLILILLFLLLLNIDLYSQSDLYRTIDEKGWIHSKKLKSGVHLGGIGAGKFELFTDGSINNYTVNNNWDRPLTDLKGIFSAVYIDYGREPVVKVLKLESEYGLPCVEEIDYKGEFPVAHLKYKDHLFPVEIELTAFSPLIPHEYIISSLPVAVLRYKVKNKLNKKIDVSVMFSWENLLGVGGDTNNKWNERTGNYQEIYNDNDYKGLYLKTEQSYKDQKQENCIGEYFLLCKSEETNDVTVLNSWNVLGNGDDMWKSFSKNGKFDNKDQKIKGEEGKYHPAGAVASKFDLNEYEEKEVYFIFSWYMPNHFGKNLNNFGHFYTNYFKNAFEITKYVYRNRNFLFERVKEWQDLINFSPFPQWLKFKLINDVWSIYSNTIYTKDGKFATLESPVSMNGVLGTIDQRFSSHAFYTACFPKFNELELQLFADIQSESGEISHFCGNINTNLGTPADKGWFTQWPDLSSSFIMQVYHYYLWTGDKDFLDKFYPNVRKAILWLKSRDFDGDLIPEGGSTWDYKHYPGAFCYTANMWLGALKSAEKMGEIKSDTQFMSLCHGWFEKAKKNIILKLWNGKYFIKYFNHESGKYSDYLFIGQLAGQWFANLINIDNLLPEDMMNKSIYSLLSINDKISEYVAPNEVKSSGEWAHFYYSWLPYTQTYLYSNAIYEGFVKEGIDGFKKIYNTVVNVNENPWNTKLYYDAKTGREDWGNLYMTAPSSWFIMYAISGYSTDYRNKEITINPNLPSDIEDYTIPVFTPNYWFKLNFYSPGKFLKKTMVLKFLKIFDKESVKLKTFKTEVPSGMITDENFNVIFEKNGTEIPGNYNISNNFLYYHLENILDIKENDEIKFSFMNIDPISVAELKLSYKIDKKEKSRVIVKAEIKNVSNTRLSGKIIIKPPEDWLIEKSENLKFSGLEENNITIANIELKIPEFVLREKQRIYITLEGKLDFKGLKFNKESSIDIGGNFVTEWNLIGPFDNSNNKALDKVYPPEQNIDLNKKYKGKNDKPIEWFYYNSEKDYIDLNSIFGLIDEATSYALCWIKSPDKREVKIKLGYDEGIKLWINDKEVFSDLANRTARPGQNELSANLTKGWNKIFIKSTETEAYWGFYFEIVDETNKPYYDLEYTTDINEIK